MNEPRLTDGVVVLDRHTLADVEAHLAGEDEEQARRFGWYPARSTAETVRRTIERWREQWVSAGPTRAFAIRDASTNELAGGCEVRLVDDHSAQMSYWIFPPFRGRGYAARSINLACDWAFDQEGVERMEIYVEPDNAASRKSAARAGFTEVGLVHSHEQAGEAQRDMVLYSRPRDLRSAPWDASEGSARLSR